MTEQDLVEVLSRATYVDLSPTIENGMPCWPSHPEPLLTVTRNHRAHGYYSQSLAIAEHTGAHIDAPAHTHEDLPRSTIEVISVETFLAPAKVFDLRPLGIGVGDLVTAVDLDDIDRVSDAPLCAGDIALLNFGWSERYWRLGDDAAWYCDNSPGLSKDACDWLQSRGAVAVGADTGGVDMAMRDGREAHPSYGHTDLLRAGVYLIECLANLGSLPRRCFFMAMPLKISNGSGSPVRAVALVFNSGD